MTLSDAFDLRSGQPYVDDCVHCGFCLDSCPTYVLWAQEADSPRGRIVQIGDAIEAGGTVSAEMGRHIDSCLGCLACVSSCPSGVRYDELLQRARPAVERQQPRSTADRALRLLLFETLPYPDRLRRLAPLLGAGRRLGAVRLPDRLGVLAQVAPAPPARSELKRRLPERTVPAGPVRGRVGLLLGCVQRVFYPEVHRATIAVLAAEGYEVLAPTLPDCCGALELHGGEAEQGTARARATIAAFAELGELDAVVVNSAGCGAAMKEYGQLVGDPVAAAFSARVRDITEFLAEIEPRAPRGPVPRRVVYHDACHLRHAQQIRFAPRDLLAGIPELELLEVVAEPDVCCGSAGIYNVVAPEPAAELGARKARNLIASGADAIAAANPGCAAQLTRHTAEQGRPLPVLHPVQLLAESIAAAGAQRAAGPSPA